MSKEIIISFFSYNDQPYGAITLYNKLQNILYYKLHENVIKVLKLLFCNIQMH